MGAVEGRINIHFNPPSSHWWEYATIKYKIQNKTYKIQNTKYKIQNTKYKIQNTTYEIQNTKNKKETQYTKYKCHLPYIL